MKKVILLLLIVFISACSNVPKGAELEQVANEKVILHPDLIDEIGVVSERMIKVGAYPAVELSLKNFTEDRYTIEYKFDWFDSSGFKIDTLQSWNRVTLSPSATSDILSVGKSEKAIQYKVNIRLPDDVFIVGE